jgi:hypothetical protein
MILLENDWTRFPNADIHRETTNKSFLELAALYSSMGISNNAFHLALMQPELRYVDPHDRSLDLTTRAMIAAECKFNPWYFFREVARLPGTGSEPIRFNANRGNIALYWCFFNHIDAANIQPRQTGKSGSTDCLMDLLIYIAGEGLKIMMITKDDQLRTANVERLKAIRDYIPPWLVPITSADANNQNELTCMAKGNKYVTGVGRSSPAAAANLGRGLSTPILQVDEGPFIQQIGKTIPAALAAGTAARRQAKESGQPYGNIFTTTAGKIDDRDGRYMYNLINGGTVWNEMFLDCRNHRELIAMVRNAANGGKKMLMNITMSHRQLGYSDEWLYETMAENNSFGEDADRDFLNIWTSGSQRSPLTVMLNESIRNSEREVLYTEISPDRFLIRWYIPEAELQTRMESGNYVLGVDTSDAVGRDAIALVITDLRDLSVVGAATVNETNLSVFTGFLFWFMMKYLNTTLIIERKSSAPAIIDMLLLKLPLAGQDPFKRIWNRIVDNYREDPDAFRELDRGLAYRDESFYERRRTSFGFNTAKESRKLLYGTVLQNAAKQAGHLVHDKQISGEIRSLVEKNGRIDHITSGHDDHVVAWLMCHFFANHGKNLTYYGINTAQVMQELGMNGRAISEEEREARLHQEQVMREFEQIMETLKSDLDDLSVAKYEHRLRVLTTRVSEHMDIEAPSVDAMIAAASEERKKRNQLQLHQRRSSQSNLPMFGNPGAFDRGSRFQPRPAGFSSPYARYY